MAKANSKQKGGFLPDEYEVPSGQGNYMKLEQGENKFRILDSPVLGWVEWVDKKPLCYPMDEKPETTDSENPPKHFWAMPVYDFSDGVVKILQLTQASVQKAIKALAADKEWGSPQGYDIKVTKKGEGLQTKYTVTPNPKKPVSKEIQKAADARPWNLQALFDGENVFESK